MDSLTDTQPISTDSRRESNLLPDEHVLRRPQGGMRSLVVARGRAGGMRELELDSSVQEEDWQRGQTYNAHWHSVCLIPRPWDRQSVVEVQYHGNQALTKQWGARMLLQRCLSGAILNGVLEPYMPPRAPQITRSQPTLPTPLGSGVRSSPGFRVEVHSATVPRRSTVGVVDLPLLGTTEVGFSKFSRSLGRMQAPKVQRG